MRDVQDGRRDSSVGELIEATWPVVLPLIGAGILAGRDRRRFLSTSRLRT